MAQAYIVRKKWEAELQAAMVVRALVGDASTGSAGGTGGYGERVSAEALLSELGVTVS